VNTSSIAIINDKLKVIRWLLWFFILGVRFSYDWLFVFLHFLLDYIWLRQVWLFFKNWKIILYIRFILLIATLFPYLLLPLSVIHTQYRFRSCLTFNLLMFALDCFNGRLISISPSFLFPIAIMSNFCSVDPRLLFFKPIDFYFWVITANVGFVSHSK